ncbi:3355_t:CDS:10, partial [Paraglomus brasilianum]
QHISEKENIGGKVMAASLPSTNKTEKIVGRIFRDKQQQTETTADSSSATNRGPPLHHCDRHIEPDSLLNDIKACSDSQVKAIEETNRTKGQILANTSHELRNLLGAITGSLSAFEGTELTSEQQDMVEVMSRASDVVISVVNDILDTAKLDARKLTLIDRVFDLWALVEKTVTMLGERAGAKELELIVLYDPETLSRYVKTDPERLQQVIMNLLSNAIKFTDNGEIVIKLSIRNSENMAVDDNPDLNKLLCVEISDTGVGIDPASIKHIWENFSQVDASMTRGRDGTGLGLSLCKSLVELNGGKIGVDSEVDDSSNLQSQPNRARNVLIIDPVEAARSAYATLIKRSVEKVYTYADYASALEAAREHKKKHDERICDLAFLSVRNSNATEVENAAKELKRVCGNGTDVAAICKPVMHNCMMDYVSNFNMFLVKPGDEDNKETKNNSISTYSGMPSSKDESESKSKAVSTQFVPMKRSASSELKDQSSNEERTSKSNRVGGLPKCILYVDDNAINRKIVKTQLDKLGYNYLEAENGKEAVDLVQTQYENSQASGVDSSQSLESKLGISLILMDCAMPVMSGFEATRAIRSLSPEFQTLPIIALTACAIAGTREQCLEAGMNDYLTKPLKIKQLKEKLNEWLGEN